MSICSKRVLIDTVNPEKMFKLHIELVFTVEYNITKHTFGWKQAKIQNTVKLVIEGHL